MSKKIKVICRLELFSSDKISIYVDIPSLLQSSFIMINRRIEKGYFRKSDIQINKYKNAIFVYLDMVLFIDSFNIMIFKSFYEEYIYFLRDENEIVIDNDIDFNYIININNACKFFLCEGQQINIKLKKIYEIYFAKESFQLINKILLFIFDYEKIESKDITPAIKKLLLINPEYDFKGYTYNKHQLKKTLVNIWVIEFMKDDNIIYDLLNFTKDIIKIKDNPITVHFIELFKDNL